MKNAALFFIFIICFNFLGCLGDSGVYYTLTFDGNGAGGTAPQAMSVPEFQYAPLPGRKWLKGELEYTGKVFRNWNTDPSGVLGGGTPYYPGDKIQMLSDMVLYAQWEGKDPLKDPLEDYKTFWAQDIEGNWYTVEAVKQVEGTHCIIYTDILETVENADITDIITEYDTGITGIHDKITGAFGDVYDMESSGFGNGKVILLLLDIKDGYTGLGGYVAGYFDPTHMYDPGTYATSNKADMLFIDIYPGLSHMSSLYATIAHELQHLINFSQTTLKSKPRKDLWIDEGLSTAAEYIYDQDDKIDRIAYFNTSHTIPYGNNFFVWEGFWEQEYGDVLADYTTAYLFFRWLGIHASNGTGIYKDIIDNPDPYYDYGDYRSVTQAAAARNINPPGPGSDWEKLLGAWMLANYYKSSTGFYGYKGDTKIAAITVTRFTCTDHAGWYFSPGEGIFSLQGSFYNASAGPYICYRGLDEPTAPPSFSPVYPYSGTTLLTFNANTNKDGPDERGYLANVTAAGTGSGTARFSVGAAGSSARVTGAGSVPAAYPVSFGDKAAGLDRPQTGGSARRPKPEIR
jgi:hypothetical protein